MDIILEFNSKSTAINIPRALEMAKTCDHEYKGKLIQVKFDDIRDLKIVPLFRLVEGLQGTRIIIDNEEYKHSYFVSRIFEAIRCEKKKTCNGLCIFIRIRLLGNNLDIEEIQELLQNNIKEDLLHIYPSSSHGEIFNKILLIREDYLENVNDNIYELDHSALIKEVLYRYQLERKYCDIFDKDKLCELLQSIPNKIFKEEEIKETRKISFERAIASTAIDNAMPEGMIYKCILALKVISGTRPSTIAGENVKIYYSTLLNQFVILTTEEILLKEELDDEDEVKEDKTSTIQFSNDLFFIETDYFKIFFQSAKDEAEFILLLKRFREK